MAIPKRVADRITSGLKRMVPIVQQQRARDVSEADTVTLVKDIMAEVFGYDKYAELTGELAIRGTYCDLATRLDDKICQLIEVKAIGLTLTERHLKQAVDYAANQGIEWVMLTNGVVWQLHHVIFAKPIGNRLICELNLICVDGRKDADLELIYAFTKEGFRKGVPTDLRDRQDATSRFLLAALLLNNDSVRAIIRRELRRVVDVNVSEEEIGKVLLAEVIKRDALEGPAAEQAARKIRQAENRSLKTESKRAGECDGEAAPGQQAEPLSEIQDSETAAE